MVWRRVRVVGEFSGRVCVRRVGHRLKLGCVAADVWPRIEHTAAHFAPILQSNEKAGALSRLCSRPMKKSRCGGGSLDGVDFKVYQRRASYLVKRVDKQGWYTGAETGRA